MIGTRARRHEYGYDTGLTAYGRRNTDIDKRILSSVFSVYVEAWKLTNFPGREVLLEVKGSYQLLSQPSSACWKHMASMGFRNCKIDEKALL